MIGMLVHRQVSEGYVLVSRSLDPPRTRHPSAVAVNQQPHHHARIVRRQPSPVALFVAGVNRRQVQRLHYICHQPRQVALGQPIVQRGRQQKHLVQIAVAKSFAHAPILRARPQLSTKKKHPRRKRCGLSSDGIYLRQTLGDPRRNAEVAPWAKGGCGRIGSMAANQGTVPAGCGSWKFRRVDLEKQDLQVQFRTTPPGTPERTARDRPDRDYSRPPSDLGLRIRPSQTDCLTLSMQFFKSTAIHRRVSSSPT